MGPGQVVADRFEIERSAGHGAMGTVFRAKDRTTGEWVALKVLVAREAQQLERFTREARILSEIRHAGIVRHLGHGILEAGSPYLVMEWLDGESLAERLERGPLGSPDTLVLARRVAEALSVLHARGVVHRDIKPTNLFLPAGSVAAVKILDFGIARPIRDAELTIPGTLLGTPGYMSPEQARGERSVDARADLFSVGCVLFKCLTGRAPIVGADVLAVLLKLVLEDPPRVGDLVRDVPEELDTLVARLLSRSPDDRPASASELLGALAELGAGGRTSRTSVPALGEAERRVVCLVLARTRPVDVHAAATVAVRAIEAREAGLRSLAERFRARLEIVADGSVLLALTSDGAATDLCARAARCALAARDLLEDSPIALVTGRAVVSGRLPVGEVIDRGARMVAHPRGSPIRIDEVTAGLLDARFEVSGDSRGLLLRREREAATSVRTFLGKQTPCVGRERELATLESLWRQCCEESVARVVVVTGPAGIGKSRLRYELLRRIQANEVWVGRGDALSAGSPFGMLSSALRDAFGLAGGQPSDVQAPLLRARVGRHVAVEDVARVSEFLGEMLGIPLQAEPSLPLRAARTDPILMGDQMLRAWEDLVQAETRAAPLVLVLEDLHWGDRPTVRFVDAVLRNLGDAPLFVIALARPEVTELFPRLWEDREVEHVRLGHLTPKSSERLARTVLGADASESAVRRVVERAGGNAFYLEELIRSVALGRGDELPETVVAMVEARLARLSADARRILRAASVFGQLFWEGGLRALLGRGADDARVAAELDALCDQELLSRRGPTTVGSEREFAFRHALLREAAYATLTEADRRLGHRLAGQWLESVGGGDPFVLAEHFERGAEPARAVGWFARAAAQALEGNDFAAVIDRVERAVTCGAEGEVRAGLRLLLAEAHRWRGEHQAALDEAAVAMRDLPRKSAGWFTAADELASAAGLLGAERTLLDVAHDLDAACRDEPLVDTASARARVLAMARVAVRLFYVGRVDLGDDLLARARAATSDELASDPVVVAESFQTQGYRAHFDDDFAGLRRSAESAAKYFVDAGHFRSACQQRINAGYACLNLGAYAEAEATLRSALADATRLGLPAVVALGQNNLGLVLARLGALEEAHATQEAAIRGSMAQGNRRGECGSRAYQASILLAMDDVAGAEKQARTAMELVTAAPLLRPFVLATLARVLLTKGEVEEARRFALEAASALDALESIEEGESLVRVVLAEALEAAGDHDGARVAIRRAEERLNERAARIGDPEARTSFLENVPENRRTRELAAREGQRGEGSKEQRGGAEG